MQTACIIKGLKIAVFSIQPKHTTVLVQDTKTKKCQECDRVAHRDKKVQVTSLVHNSATVSVSILLVQVGFTISSLIQKSKVHSRTLSRLLLYPHWEKQVPNNGACHIWNNFQSNRKCGSLGIILFPFHMIWEKSLALNKSSLAQQLNCCLM